MAKEAVRILVIDDESSILMSHGLYFQEMGHPVQMAESAEIGLNLIRDDQPDVVLVDSRLPGLQGLDFIEQAHELCPRTVFFLYTGDVGTEIPPALAAWGFSSDQIIEKPCFNLESLRQKMIERALP